MRGAEKGREWEVTGVVMTCEENVQSTESMTCVEYFKLQYN